MVQPLSKLLDAAVVEGEAQIWPISSLQIDKISKKLTREYLLISTLEEVSPLVVYDDDDPLTFWVEFKDGSGNSDITRSEESTNVKKGASATKLDFSTGSYWGVGVAHSYTSDQDWSGYDFMRIWYYGANSGKQLRIQIRCPDYLNYKEWRFTENWSGWKPIVIALRSTPDDSLGSPNLQAVREIIIYYPDPASTFTTYIDRTIVDVGQWVKCEFRVPDTLQATRANFWSWGVNDGVYHGARFAKIHEDYAESFINADYLEFLSGLRGNSIVTEPGNIITTYDYNSGGAIQSAQRGAAGPITYSSYYGVRKRIGIAIKTPPPDYDPSTPPSDPIGRVNISRMKVEIFYDDEGKTTYTFENSLDKFYGLQNIVKKYLCLYRLGEAGVIDFLQLESGYSVSGLEVVVDENEDVREVAVVLSGGDETKRIFWGQHDGDPSVDSDGDGIPDVVEEIESFVDGGGWM